MRSLRSLVGLVTVSVGVIALLPAAAGAGEAPAVVVGNDMPSWSPDGRSIAYVSFQGGRVGDIFTMRPDGKGKRRLTRTQNHEDMPRYSPDGSQIAFVRHTGGAAVNFHVFVMNADGTNVRQVTHDGAPNFAPTWSPDGSKLAFVSTGGTTGFSSNPDIYVINVDGTGRTRVTTHPGRDDSPDWSPDGTKIVFESNGTPLGNVRLFTVRPDGSERTELTKDPVPWHNETRPAWSRDGRTIAFVTDRHPPLTNSEIYLLDADGSNPRRITNNERRDDTPTWSPDGRRIALTRGLALRPEIHVLPATGGKATKVTGVNLKFVRLLRSTKFPSAGRYYTVDLVVRPSLDPYADVACYAAIGKTILDPAFAGIRRGRVRCAWFVPRSAKGKKLYGFAGARAGGTQASRTFSVRIR